MNATHIGWMILILLIYSVGAVMAFVFLFKPHTLVRRQAALYHRVYKEQSKISDPEIDRSIKPFWFLFMIDSMSHLVNRGQAHPEEFPRMIIYYRFVGGLILIPLLIGTGFLIWGALTGILIVAQP